MNFNYTTTATRSLAYINKKIITSDDFKITPVRLLTVGQVKRGENTKVH